jgi:hypothetical protein
MCIPPAITSWVLSDNSLRFTIESSSQFVRYLDDAENFVLNYGSIAFSPMKNEVKIQHWKQRLSFIEKISGIRDRILVRRHSKATTILHQLHMITQYGFGMPQSGPRNRRSRAIATASMLYPSHQMARSFHQLHMITQSPRFRDRARLTGQPVCQNSSSILQVPGIFREYHSSCSRLQKIVD